ncbi:hypothetical protein B0H11DRAFT_1943361 [Mycena galericulata]|nr:hypothetical protein B0H11DRAFT_1943361 [Mycena galericulata]
MPTLEALHRVKVHVELDKKWTEWARTQTLTKKSATHGPLSSMFFLGRRPIFSSNISPLDEGRSSEFETAVDLQTLLQDNDMRYNQVPEVLIYDAKNKCYCPMSFHCLKVARGRSKGHALGNVVVDILVAPRIMLFHLNSRTSPASQRTSTLRCSSSTRAAAARGSRRAGYGFGGEAGGDDYLRRGRGEGSVMMWAEYHLVDRLEHAQMRLGGGARARTREDDFLLEPVQVGVCDAPDQPASALGARVRAGVTFQSRREDTWRVKVREEGTYRRLVPPRLSTFAISASKHKVSKIRYERFGRAHELTLRRRMRLGTRRPCVPVRRVGGSARVFVNSINANEHSPNDDASLSHPSTRSAKSEKTGKQAGYNTKERLEGEVEQKEEIHLGTPSRHSEIRVISHGIPSTHSALNSVSFALFFAHVHLAPPASLSLPYRKFKKSAPACTHGPGIECSLAENSQLRLSRIREPSANVAIPAGCQQRREFCEQKLTRGGERRGRCEKKSMRFKSNCSSSVILTSELPDKTDTTNLCWLRFRPLENGWPNKS